jgi:anti-anti-sigma regulatory factor
MFRPLHRRTCVPISRPLTAANVLIVDSALAAALLEGNDDILLDLRQVDTCDNAGAALIHAFIDLVLERGGQVEIHGAVPAVSAALAEARPTG